MYLPGCLGPVSRIAFARLEARRKHTGAENKRYLYANISGICWDGLAIYERAEAADTARARTTGRGQGDVQI